MPPRPVSFVRHIYDAVEGMRRPAVASPVDEQLDCSCKSVRKLPSPSLTQPRSLQLDNFILTFAASRGVATLVDLDAEASAFLQQQLIPCDPTSTSLGLDASTAGAGAAAAAAAAPPKPLNPDEIEVGDDDDSTEGDGCADDDTARGAMEEVGPLHGNGGFDSHFTEFGVGNLIHHPLVQRIWRPPPDLTLSDCVGFADVAPWLMEMVLGAMTPASTALHAPPEPLGIGQCSDHLCGAFEVGGLEEVGVLLVERALPAVLRGFRHTELKACVCPPCSRPVEIPCLFPCSLICHLSLLEWICLLV